MTCATTHEPPSTLHTSCLQLAWAFGYRVSNKGFGPDSRLKIDRGEMIDIPVFAHAIDRLLHAWLKYSQTPVF